MQSRDKIVIRVLVYNPEQRNLGDMRGGARGADTQTPMNAELTHASSIAGISYPTHFVTLLINILLHFDEDMVTISLKQYTFV